MDKTCKIHAVDLFTNVMTDLMNKRQSIEDRMALTHTLAPQFKQAAGIINRAAKISGNRPLSHYAYVYGAQVELTITLYLNSLKNRQFVNFLSYIDGNMNYWDSFDNVGKYGASRRFDYRDDKLSLSIDVELPTDGDKCYRKQTGTTFVEQNTYEIVCN